MNKTNLGRFQFDARADTFDYRDKIYTPTLVDVPIMVDLQKYKEVGVPVLVQGNEGACTGFGLATVANYLLRRRTIGPDEMSVSPRMLYEMAKRYDEWPGEAYSAASARSALKGWHKHGVCAESVWKYREDATDLLLTHRRAEDALKRPLESYFRVPPRNISIMKAACAEAGILYATINVHDGWGRVNSKGVIYYDTNVKIRGGHAFAIVAYDEEGFWIQNSWSDSWGKGGFAKITYKDWLWNAMDVWIAQLGAPRRYYQSPRRYFISGTHPYTNNKYSTRPDTLDDRDLIYKPGFFVRQARYPLEYYKDQHISVLDQGDERESVGFGLATVANYLLRNRLGAPDDIPVSPDMLNEMSKYYDKWPGESHFGSSARMALKAWHKNGVCAESIWISNSKESDKRLNRECAQDAAKRPLNAYYRINCKNLDDMQNALVEFGILFAMAWIHEGWIRPDASGSIPFSSDFNLVGGHAFAIVAYDEQGFWLQNSWGTKWGRDGFARLGYEDWLENGCDVWVAQVEPTTDQKIQKISRSGFISPRSELDLYTIVNLQPHVINLREWRLDHRGPFGTSKQAVSKLFEREIPRITKHWQTKRIILYAPSGLLSYSESLQRFNMLRAAFLDAQVYPVVFLWHTGFWDAIVDDLKATFYLGNQERALKTEWQFMLDRLEYSLELAMRESTGKIQWDEMKENAWRATLLPDGGARLTAQYLADMMDKQGNVEVHLLAHSAGSIFLAPLVQYLTTTGVISGNQWSNKTQGLGRKITSCTLWAPGIGIEEFRQTYIPAIQSGAVKRFALYTLTDEAELEDNCEHIYNRSLLYLISNALEENYNEPLVGLEKFVKEMFVWGWTELRYLFSEGNAEWIKAPNNEPKGSPIASGARRHREFDNDLQTIQSTLLQILKAK